MTEPKTKLWNVFVYRGSFPHYLGMVQGTKEEYARCAALSQYGDEKGGEDKIGLMDEFTVQEVQ